jgi:hypothetical protein
MADSKAYELNGNDLVATACMSKEFVVMIVVGLMLLHMLAPQHLKKVDLVCRDRCFEGND